MTLREESKELGISASYLFDILHGYKGCSEKLMLNIKHLHPELDFTLLNPRYILRKDKNKHNYMEQEYNNLLELYNIRSEDFKKTDMRNQKAINVIEDFIRLNYSTIDLQYLLNILRGEDNE